MWLLGFLVVAFVVFAACFVVGWVVALGRADHRGIEQDSAGV
jgi:hypothetical protein